MSVYRGVGLAHRARTIVWILGVYTAVLSALWAVGLAVYGWRGWLLVLAPLAAWIAARAWAWQRVSVELTEDTLRYEGAARRDDVEVRLDQIASARADRAGLLLTTRGGEELAIEIAPDAAHALARRIGR